MPPLSLNPWQRDTLAALQALARDDRTAVRHPVTGCVLITLLQPRLVPRTADAPRRRIDGRRASGLHSAAVWTALERKGLARSHWPRSIELTPAGLEFDTSLSA